MRAATVVPGNPASTGVSERPDPSGFGKVDNHRQSQQTNQAPKPRIRRTPGRPPPNPGGYGPFQAYACQAPNGWLVDNLWITAENPLNLWTET
jgi:hypothetical protein